jgi:hypothetical protein
MQHVNREKLKIEHRGWIYLSRSSGTSPLTETSSCNAFHCPSTMRLFKIYAISLHAMVFLSLSDGQLTDPFSVMVGDEIWYESASRNILIIPFAQYGSFPHCGTPWSLQL